MKPHEETLTVVQFDHDRRCLADNRWACPMCGKLVSKYAFRRHVKGCAEPLPLALAAEHSLPTWPLGSALCFSKAS